MIGGNIMKKKNSFEKRYPLFSKYITEEIVQNNMLDNIDLSRKYKTYNEIIKMFVGELEKHFDVETIRDMIIESIIKLPDEMLVSLMKAYLASDEDAKSNIEFIKYFNKTSNFGRESLDYIVSNGLITNRKYRDIPNLAIDYHYNKIKNGNESFKGVPLEMAYNYLTYPQRSFIISLMESGAISFLDEIFASFNFNIINLIKILMDNGIDKDILNKENIEAITTYSMMLLVCLIMEMNEPLKSVQVLKKILESKRYDLIQQIIVNNYVSILANVNYEEITSMTDEEIIKLLNQKELVYKKQCA